MRDLPHIIGQVFNTPLMIHTPKLDTVLGAVGNRILRGEPLGEQQRPEPGAKHQGRGAAFSHGGYLCDGGIAVLPVLGTLIRRGSWLDSYSGLTSYDAISQSIGEMVAAPAVRGIMLEIDSFGGEAGGCFDLVGEVKKLSSQHGKPIWAVANEASASAAYAIACAAEQIWLPQMGVVGSIGVVCAHVDMSEADKMDGLKWTYIFAGEHKVDGNPHEPLSVGARADLQADVDDIAGKFHALVAANRGMSLGAVRSTKARMYRGKDAVAAGLANQVGTFEQAMAAFSERLRSGAASGRRFRSTSTATGNSQMSGQDVKRTSEEDAALWERATARAAARRCLSMSSVVVPDRSEGWGAAMQRQAHRAGIALPAKHEAEGSSSSGAVKSYAASWERAMARAAAKRPPHQSA